MTNQKRSRVLGRPRIAEDAKPTNELILQAATKLFLKDGFQRVSIDDIAKEVGMTKATVYYYFESKADLFKESMVALMERVREHIIRLVSSDKSFYERLFEVALSHLQATTTIDLEGFMRESRTSLTNDHVQEMKAAEENMFLSIEQAFLNAIEQGEIPKINAKFAAHAYIALVKVGNYRQPDGTSFFPTVEETATHILTVFWKGFFGD